MFALLSYPFAHFRENLLKGLFPKKKRKPRPLITQWRLIGDFRLRRGFFPYNSTRGRIPDTISTSLYFPHCGRNWIKSTSHRGRPLPRRSYQLYNDLLDHVHCSGYRERCVFGRPFCKNRRLKVWIRVEERPWKVKHLKVMFIQTEMRRWTVTRRVQVPDPDYVVDNNWQSSCVPLSYPVNKRKHPKNFI